MASLVKLHCVIVLWNWLGRCSGGVAHWHLAADPSRGDELKMSRIPGYEAAFASAQLSVPQLQAAAKFPWETNRVIRNILGDRTDIDFKRPRISLEQSTTSSSSTAAPLSKDDLARQVKLAVPKVRPSTGHLFCSDPEASRDQALNAWMQLLKLDLGESVTDRQIAKILGEKLTLEKQASLAMDSIEMTAQQIYEHATTKASFHESARKLAGPACPSCTAHP